MDFIIKLSGKKKALMAHVRPHGLVELRSPAGIEWSGSWNLQKIRLALMTYNNKRD